MFLVVWRRPRLVNPPMHNLLLLRPSHSPQPRSRARNLASIPIQKPDFLAVFGDRRLISRLNPGRDTCQGWIILGWIRRGGEMRRGQA
eukprot:89526-Amorphochlora_amoeboformis.AAC.4